MQPQEAYSLILEQRQSNTKYSQVWPRNGNNMYASN